jgi:hypothetical protein
MIAPGALAQVTSPVLGSWRQMLLARRSPLSAAEGAGLGARPSALALPS